MVKLWNFFSFCGTEELDLSEQVATLALIKDFYSRTAAFIFQQFNGNSEFIH